MSIVKDRLVRLDEIQLAAGGHKTFEDGVCAVEMVSWLAGEPFSDRPACISPVLGAFLRSWNDALDDEERQMLKPFLPRAISTSSDGRDEERAWLCTDWLVRTCAPAWLDLAGVKEAPSALRALPPITSTEAAREAQPTISDARSKGAAAGAAAGDAAWDAAWAAARAAAWDAAWAAARAAAWDALEPTKLELQRSALELLEKMVKREGATV